MQMKPTGSVARLSLENQRAVAMRSLADAPIRSSWVMAHDAAARNRLLLELANGLLLNPHWSVARDFPPIV
jgi:hypothetical protein